jgi:endonuclease/exonuclease/phosphatase family metal-dependent hydrolase
MLFRALQRLRRGMPEPGRRITTRVLPPRSTANPQEIVVFSANLWHDWPLRRRLPERLEDLARMIEAQGADVVLLQEAVRIPGLSVDRWLSERLGMSSLYSRANGHEGAIGFEEGLAIFARFPIATSRVRRLEPRFNRYVNRLALGAEMQTPFGSLWAFSVHLGLLRPHNASQVGDLRAWVADVTGEQSAVIGGDFNAPEHAPHMIEARRNWLDTFRHLNPHADGTTHELRWPWGSSLRRHRLDYLFLHKAETSWQVREAKHLDGDHSDHRAVMARISPAKSSEAPPLQNP